MQETNTFEEKSEKMTLMGYYKSLPGSTSPKTEFVNRVIKETGVSYPSVMNWVFGKTKPSNPKIREQLSKITGIPVEDLFE